MEFAMRILVDHLSVDYHQIRKVHISIAIDVPTF